MNTLVPGFVSDETKLSKSIEDKSRDKVQEFTCLHPLFNFIMK